jgi:DNA-binding NarL/FixJ family response regulator
MHSAEIATKTSVSIISHSRLFRETIAAWLELQKEVAWVAAAGSMCQLFQRLGGRAADVLLAHTRVDGILGAEFIWDARVLLSATHLIVLGYRQSEQDVIRWREAGAMDYLEQDASPSQLLDSIRDVAIGRPGCSMALHTRAIQLTRSAAHFAGPVGDPLSDRDRACFGATLGVAERASWPVIQFKSNRR